MLRLHHWPQLGKLFVLLYDGELVLLTLGAQAVNHFIAQFDFFESQGRSGAFRLVFSSVLKFNGRVILSRCRVMVQLLRWWGGLVMVYHEWVGLYRHFWAGLLILTWGEIAVASGRIIFKWKGFLSLGSSIWWTNNLLTLDRWDDAGHQFTELVHIVLWTQESCQQLLQTVSLDPNHRQNFKVAPLPHLWKALQVSKDRKKREWVKHVNWNLHDHLVVEIWVFLAAHG